MQYAQTGIHSYLPPGGACRGHTYDQRADRNDHHMSVNCLACEPFLAADPLWAPTPALVPLTELEQRQLDEQKSRADAVTASMMAQMANQAMAVVAAQADAAVAEAKTTPPARKPRARKTTNKAATTASA